MRKKKALVVDNEKIAVEVLAGILENEGLQVEKAYGGIEALEKLKHQKFEIVFLDLIMPRIDGGRICKFIKQSPEHRDTKVVMVTACVLEAEQKLVECKADVYIAKSPKMKNNIKQALQLIEANQPISESVVLGKEGIRSRTIVKELLFSQRYFEAILSSMSEGVVELDMQNIITYVNPAAQAILEKREWELIGLKFTDVIDHKEVKDLNLLLKEHPESTRSITKELCLRPDSGREFELSFKKVVREGETIGATVVINDITEKKMLEKERYLRERLTGVMEMATTAAHELNQPLSVISGNSQLLLMDSGKCSETICKRIRSILDQVERLAELTKKFSSIVTYKTKEFGGNIKIVDIEKASCSEDKSKLKGMWE